MTLEQLKQIEDFAYLLADVPELAVLTGLSEGDIRASLTDPANELGRTIHRGWLLRKLEYRKAVFKASDQGSGPAQTMVMQFIQRMVL